MERLIDPKSGRPIEKWGELIASTIDQSIEFDNAHAAGHTNLHPTKFGRICTHQQYNASLGGNLTYARFTPVIFPRQIRGYKDSVDLIGWSALGIDRFDIPTYIKLIRTRYENRIAGVINTTTIRCTLEDAGCISAEETSHKPAFPGRDIDLEEDIDSADPRVIVIATHLEYLELHKV